MLSREGEGDSERNRDTNNNAAGDHFGQTANSNAQCRSRCLKGLNQAVIITAGTFMRGVLHIGDKRIDGGRVGEKPSIGLSDQLKDLGVSVFRLKTLGLNEEPLESTVIITRDFC